MSFGATLRRQHRPPYLRDSVARGQMLAAMYCYTHHRRTLPCIDCWAQVVRFGWRHAQGHAVIVRRPSPIRITPLFWRRS